MGPLVIVETAQSFFHLIRFAPHTPTEVRTENQPRAKGDAVQRAGKDIELLWKSEVRSFKGGFAALPSAALLL